MVKRIVSSIWDFFEKVTDSPHLARCKICHKTASRGSADPSKMTVTNLKNHLSSNHNDEFKKFKELETSQSQKRVAESDAETSKNSKQTKISFTKTYSNHWDDKDPRSLICHKAVLKYLIWDMVPYHEVTNEGFGQLIRTLNPKFKLASEKFYRSMLGQQYNDC